MLNAIVTKIKTRKIHIGNCELIDFASCNYLGFDLNQTIIESIEPALNKWGMHPSWSRQVASPYIYDEAEEALADLIGCKNTLIFPTVTLIGIGVIPALAGKDGVIFADKNSHVNLHEASKIAKCNGCKIFEFEQTNLDDLEISLRANSDNPNILILADGVDKITGNYANLKPLVSLAQKYNATMYIDDAHGFGVVGEMPDNDSPYGYKGNGIVKHLGQDYSNIIYVGGLSKAYSSLAAFISCSAKMKEFIKASSFPYFDSGPCSIASLQTIISGLLVNQQNGDSLRKKIYFMTKTAIDGIRLLGFKIQNQTYFPIISIVFDMDQFIKASQALWDSGILVTAFSSPNKNHILRITMRIGRGNNFKYRDPLVVYAEFAEAIDHVNVPGFTDKVTHGKPAIEKPGFAEIIQPAAHLPENLRDYFLRYIRYL